MRIRNEPKREGCALRWMRTGTEKARAATASAAGRKSRNTRPRRPRRSIRTGRPSVPPGIFAARSAAVPVSTAASAGFARGRRLPDRTESSSAPESRWSSASVAPHAPSAEAAGADATAIADDSARATGDWGAGAGTAAGRCRRPPLSELPTIPVARERTPTPHAAKIANRPATPDRSRRPAVAGTRRPVQSKAPSKAYSFGLIAASVAVVAALARRCRLAVRATGCGSSARGAGVDAGRVREARAPASEPPPSDVAPLPDERPAVKDAVAADAVKCRLVLRRQRHLSQRIPRRPNRNPSRHRSPRARLRLRPRNR